MDIFEKGLFQAVHSEFIQDGIIALSSVSKFQEQYNLADTDTAINTVRDNMIAYYLGYDLVNIKKHGFDAKKSDSETFLEIKQCSISSESWGGTWNDTNEEKAMAFSDPRLFTAVAVWKNAAEFLFVVYGQHHDMGENLLRLVRNRPAGTRSTQSLPISKLIIEYGFKVYYPPHQSFELVSELLVVKNRKLLSYANEDIIRPFSDLQ